MSKWACGCMIILAMIPFLFFIFSLGPMSNLASKDPKNSPNFPGGPNSGVASVDKKCCIEKIKSINSNIDDETAGKYCEWIVEAANANNLSPALLAATISVESKFNKNAVSESNAVGLMQHLPAAAIESGITNWKDPPPNPPDENLDSRFNPHKSIQAGAIYLARIRDTYYKGIVELQSNMDYVIGGYNKGPNAIKNYYNSYRTILPGAKTYIKSVNDYIEQWEECFSYANNYNAECGDKIVNEAKLHIGKDYLFGAIGPEKFDCRGLVWYVIRKALGEGRIPGVTADCQGDPAIYIANKYPVPASVVGPIGPCSPHPTCTSDQDKGNYPLDFSKLNKGDILFWDTMPNLNPGHRLKGCNGITHVGIYAGDKKMIHAGEPVGYRDLANYSPKFKGAVSFCGTGTTTSELDCKELKNKITDLTKWPSDPNLTNFKAKMVEYSKNHTHENTWQLTNPKYIVLHITAGSTMASVSNDFLRGGDLRADKDDEGKSFTYSGDGKPPAISVHFVIDKQGNIAQLLPLNVRSRGTYGANHNTISIEHVGTGNFSDKQAEASAKLTKCLMDQSGIPLNNIISHTLVGKRMNDPAYQFFSFRAPPKNNEKEGTYPWTCPGPENTENPSNLVKVKNLIKNYKD